MRRCLYSLFLLNVTFCLLFPIKILHNVEELDNGDGWIRVYIGEYESELAARKTGEGLFAKGIITYFKPIEIDKTELGR